MTVTNGQDQSATFQREQGRRDFEQGREKSPLTAFKPEERGPVGPQSAGSEFVRALVSRRQSPLERQRAWNVGADPNSDIEPKGHPTTFPVRSRQTPTGLAEGYKNVCKRWSLDAHGMANLLHLEEEIGLCDMILSGQVPPMTGDLKDRMALVIGISIGLGELFNDDKDAELQWLTSTRTELGCVSPLEHVLKGDLLNLRDVVGLVDNARGLR